MREQNPATKSTETFILGGFYILAIAALQDMKRSGLQMKFRPLAFFNR